MNRQQGTEALRGQWWEVIDFENSAWFVSCFGKYQGHFAAGDGAVSIKSAGDQLVLYHAIFWVCKTHVNKCWKKPHLNYFANNFSDK